MMFEYGIVEHQAKRIVIVACGPSVRVVPLRRLETTNAYVIAINGAMGWLPHVDAWFTLDADERTRPFMQSKRTGVTYYAAVPRDYGQPDARAVAHRREPEPGIIYLERVEFENKQKWVPMLSEDPRKIHTGNSAWGGLQLACHMGAKKILLLGVDATTEKYVYGEGRPRDLTKLPYIMGTAVAQLNRDKITVVNGSPNSAVRCFTRMQAIPALDWLERMEGC